MMIAATQIRVGTLVIHNGELHRVHEMVHKTPGNLRGFVQVKMRNLRSGSMVDHRYGSTDRVEKASLDEREMEYLYEDAAGYHFMDQESYETLTLSGDVLGDDRQLLVDNVLVQVQKYNGSPIGVQFPPHVELTVTFTEPGVRGDTAAGRTCLRRTDRRAPDARNGPDSLRTCAGGELRWNFFPAAEFSFVQRRARWSRDASSPPSAGPRRHRRL